MRSLAVILGTMLLFASPGRAEPDLKLPPIKRTSPAAFPYARLDRFGPLADIAESEPNEVPASAQGLACGNSLRPARLANGAGADLDWITFTAAAGELITFETASDTTEGSPETDTFIHLFAADGTTVLASNDDAGDHTLFSRIADFEAPYSGAYFGRIRGFNAAEGPYRANLTCVPSQPPPANDRCENALLIAPGNIALSGTTRYATNDYDLCPGTPECASCTGFHSPGRDVVYRVVIGQPGEVLTLAYEVTPATADASIYLVTDCSDPSGTCVAGQDTDLLTPVEHLTHTFATPGTYYLVLDAFTASGGSWTLSGCLGCPTASRPVSWGRLKVMYR